MGRIFLYLVFAATAAADTRVRGWMAPYAQTALDPVQEWAARSSVSEIARILDAEAAVGRELPTSEELPAYLAQNRAGFNPDRDPWGTPYFYREEFYARRVASAGPDREEGTEDDIVSGVLNVATR